MQDANVTHAEITLTEDEDRSVRRAAFLQDALPEVDYEIEGMVKTTKSKAFKAIREGSLTPEQALSYWMELFSYDRLQNRLKQKANAAQSTETNRRT